MSERAKNATGIVMLTTSPCIVLGAAYWACLTGNGIILALGTSGILAWIALATIWGTWVDGVS